MHSWEIVCVDVDADSDHTDCRAVTELGYLAPTLRTKRADVVGAQIQQGHRAFHVEVDGQRHSLVAERHPELHFYVRTLAENDESDPLLTLPSTSEYEMDDRLEGVA